MELFLDTANIEQIKKYAEILPLSGVTTNPSIIKNEGQIDFFKQLNEIRAIIGKEAFLHTQVVAKDSEGMLKDAEKILENIDQDVFIKVPVSVEGLKVIKALKRQSVHVTATAVYTEMQAYYAIAAGVDYLAPYFNRMENLAIHADGLVKNLAEEILRNHSSTKILAASFKNAGQVTRAIENGAQAVTISVEVAAQTLAHPAVIKAVDDFAADWESIFGKDSTVSSL